MASGRRILLLINTGKPEVRDALPTIRAAVSAGGGQIVHETAAIEAAPVAWDHQTSAAMNNPDLIVTLGGDGTLLAQARRFVNARLPMLGVNFGKLGFLAEFDLASLVDHSGQLFGGRALSTIERPMLEVFIVRAGADPHRDTDGPFHLALNDAAIIAGPPHRMIRVGLSVDGHPGPRILGDGVIVCTPAGSTAYNVSAGGPILAPEVRAVCITAIAAHTLAFRPVVISGESTVELTLDRANDPPLAQAEGAPGCGTVLLLDGRDAGKLATGDRVITRLHRLPASFVKNPDVGYWETLGTKMHWGVGPGR